MELSMTHEDEDLSISTYALASKGRLPLDFDAWDYYEYPDDMWTVAHEAACYGHLRESIDIWGRKDKGGLSVLFVFVDCNGEDTLRRWEGVWLNNKPKCRTPDDWEVFKQYFPDVYLRHHMEEMFCEVNAITDVQML
jgi:hypothetical protein